MRIVGVTACLVVGLTFATRVVALDVDPQFPPYKPVSIGSAQIKSVGSDTMGDLMRNWSAAFTKQNPDVKIEIDSRGSGTAPQALLTGAAQLGPMSRPMQSEEYEPFEKKYGYHPASAPVAVDALAVYVNKENPIQCLTLLQLDDIFSKGYMHANGANYRTWGDVGLTGDWANADIKLFGRNADSGTHDTFLGAVLQHGEFRSEVKEESSSADVVKMVAADKYAIGYSGIGYLTDGVRTVPLAVAPGEQCYDTSPASTYSGKYPLGRYLSIYVNKAPEKPLEPQLLEFMKFILSRDGQLETIKSGFYPIPASIRAKAVSALGLEAGSE